MATRDGQAAAQFVFNRMVQQGINPTYAAAAVGHLVEETGWFAPDVIAGRRRGDQGTAGYLAQWRGERLANLQRFARENRRPLDLATQVDFLVHEGRAGLDSGAARWYRQATQGGGDLRDAVASFAHFERPAGYNVRNPYGIQTFGKRLQHANTVSQLVGGAAPGVGADVPEYLAGVAGDPSARVPNPASYNPTAQGNVGAQSNVGNYTAPNLDIDYGRYGIETPNLSNPNAQSSSGLTTATLFNGMPYIRAFANDPYLEGRV